jgi:ribosomal protein S14
MNKKTQQRKPCQVCMRTRKVLRRVFRIPERAKK